MLLRIVKLLLVVSFVGSAWASSSPIQDNLLSMIKPLLEKQEALEAQLENLDAERKGAYSIEQFRDIEKKIDSVNQSLADILLKLRVLGQGIGQLPDDVEALALMDGELDELLLGEDEAVDQELSEEELLERQMAESFAIASEENQENWSTQEVEDTQGTHEVDSLVSFAQEIGDEEMVALLVSGPSESEAPESSASEWETSEWEVPESVASELEENPQINVVASDEEYDEWGDVDDVSGADNEAAWQARQQIAQASAAQAAQARGSVNSQFGVIAQERARKRAELGEGLQAIAQGMQQVVVQMEVEKRQSEAAALERRQNSRKAAFQAQNQQRQYQTAINNCLASQKRPGFAQTDHHAATIHCRQQIASSMVSDDSRGKVASSAGQGSDYSIQTTKDAYILLTSQFNEQTHKATVPTVEVINRHPGKTYSRLSDYRCALGPFTQEVAQRFAQEMLSGRASRHPFRIKHGQQRKDRQSGEWVRGFDSRSSCLTPSYSG